MSRHDVVKRHDFRSAMKTKEKLSSMKSVRFDGIYSGKEAEVGQGRGCVHIYIYMDILGSWLCCEPIGTFLVPKD